MLQDAGETINMPAIAGGRRMTHVKLGKRHPSATASTPAQSSSIWMNVFFKRSSKGTLSCRSHALLQRDAAAHADKRTSGLDLHASSLSQSSRWSLATRHMSHVVTLGRWTPKPWRYNEPERGDLSTHNTCNTTAMKREPLHCENMHPTTHILAGNLTMAGVKKARRR